MERYRYTSVATTGSLPGQYMEGGQGVGNTRAMTSLPKKPTTDVITLRDCQKTYGKTMGGGEPSDS